MKISIEQARAAIQEAEATGERSARLRRYGLTSPHFIVWGTIWTVAFALCEWQPARSGMIWTIFNTVGITASLAIMLSRSKARGFTSASARYLGITAALVLFFSATFIMLKPSAPQQYAAFIVITAAMMYVVGGIFLDKRRIALTGIALATMTVLGYTAFYDHFFGWMSVVGGALLVAAGLWLKRV